MLSRVSSNVSSASRSGAISKLVQINQAEHCTVPARFYATSVQLRCKDNSDNTRNLQTQPNFGQRQGPSKYAQTEETQGLQGEPVHYFTPPYSRDVMSQLNDTLTGDHAPETHSPPAEHSGLSRAQEMVSADSYEHSSHVSLYSCMQSNVPHPYNKGPTHLNMPSGGHAQHQKYISGMLTDVHPTRKFSTSTQSSAESKPEVSSSIDGAKKQAGSGVEGQGSRVDEAGSGVSSGEGSANKDLSQTARLKMAVKDYGATVVVFHVGISLASLGGFYVAVSSGIDMVGILQSMGIGQSILESKLVTGASTFVVAYAVHKVFAPVRIATTLTCTPFIVRHLRKIGFLKPPKNS